VAVRDGCYFFSVGTSYYSDNFSSGSFGVELRLDVISTVIEDEEAVFITS
jgi:hypothetical protein